jgi:hypothetical protein
VITYWGLCVSVQEKRISLFDPLVRVRISDYLLGLMRILTSTRKENIPV